MRPESENELAAMIRGASGPLSVTGGASRLLPGEGQGTRIDMSAMTGITLYEPAALTLVVRAGTPLAEVNAALAAENQMLGFEPDPRPGSTIGGVAASNASGPRRVAGGACRDAMLGVRLVTGDGRIVKNGGRVMKNVTGYDLVKLLAGSHGTLGVLSEVSFKVLPTPEAVRTLVLHGVTGRDALDAMTRAITSPFEVSGAAHLPGDDPRVLLRIEGFAGSVAYRVDRLKALLADLGEISVIDTPEENAALWRAIRDVEALKDRAAVWRISMTPGAMMTGLLPALGDDARHVQLDWAGGLCWLGADTGAVELHGRLQALVADRDVNAGGGGHATLIKGDEALRASVPVFQPQPAPIAALSEGLRDRFDPRGILNPGLMG